MFFRPVQAIAMDRSIQPTLEIKLGSLEKYLHHIQKQRNMQNGKNSIADRELIITRLLHAPVELVWEVWTNPEHIKNWWGPNGFTNTITKMNVEVNGEWDLVMHGPDGRDYKNKSVFKEVIPFKKIVYQHVSHPSFTATITFDGRGETTFLHWHMLFENKEQFIQVVKTFKADEGLKQNIEKLEIYLSKQ
jgi:uncharacterized protein YndB with AHSA1/START domain